jgi:uncharacterized membrane protein
MIAGGNAETGTTTMTQVWAALAFGCAMAGAAPALAELRICNDTGVPQSVAVGYRSGEGWASEGWWTIGQGQCKIVLGGELDQQYYFYRSEADDWTFVGQGYFFCTSATEFTIAGPRDCAARGYERREFRVIDTGGKTASATVTMRGASGPMPRLPRAQSAALSRPHPGGAARV